MRAKRSAEFQSKALRALPLVAAVLGPAACASTTGEEFAAGNEAVTANAERYLSPWNDADRTTWYTTPQGSHLIDYGVFRALEVPANAESFSARKNLEPLGFVYPPKNNDAPTFEGLPLGVLKDTSTFD